MKSNLLRVQDVGGDLLHPGGQDLHRGDKRAGVPRELHEEAALDREEPDDGEPPRHHAQVHPLRTLEPHRRVAADMQR